MSRRIGRAANGSRPHLVDDPPVLTTAAFVVARALGDLSRAWGRVGLGRMYQALRTLPGMRDVRARVEFMPGGAFETEVFEPYWGPAVIGGRPYEPDVMAAMRRFAPLSKTFIDCGANYGFWSVVATAPEFGFTDVVAVEASPSTFARLQANAHLNDGRFVCVNRAISDSAGRTVLIDEGAGHVRASVGDVGTAVLTTTIDGLIEELHWLDRDRVVVKIDVEGEERAAFRGAARLASQRDHVWIFEDFARVGLPTLRMFAELGYAIFYLRTEGPCISVPTVDRALAVLGSERRAGRARNFVAVRARSVFCDPLASWAG